MADFIWKPDDVNPGTPRDNILRSPSENFKQTFYEVDSNVEQFFTLLFGNISKTLDQSANYRDAIYAHFIANKMFLTNFNWTNVPTYISGDHGSSISVRYWDYDEVPIADGNIWNVTVVFRKEV